MSSHLPKLRPVVYGVLSYALLFLLGRRLPGLYFRTFSEVSGFGNFGVSAVGSVLGALVMFLLAPACSGFLLTRTVRQRPVLHFALGCLSTFALFSIAGYGPLTRNKAESGLLLICTSIALAFAALGAWLGYRRQARLNDEQLDRTLRSL